MKCIFCDEDADYVFNGCTVCKKHLDEALGKIDTFFKEWTDNSLEETTNAPE